MTESVEWERLADHEEAPGDRAELTRRPLCDRISYVADQLEASITGLRGLVGVSRTRVVLAASVVTLREVADLVLDQGVELDDLRQQLQSATVLPERWRDLMAERDAARRELAEVREWIGELREEWGVRTYDNDDETEVMRTREQAEDLATAWRTEIPNSNPTVRVRTRCAPGPWRDVEDGEWKAADGG